MDSHFTTPETGKKEQKTALEQFGRDLTSLALSGRLDPVIGRDTEIRRVVEVLSRRTKNNPVLVGEPGVGKTAIAEGLALRIVNKDVPELLWDKKIVALDLSALLAGSLFRGSFEARMTAVLKEVRSHNGKIILFIDELHNLSLAGGGEGSMDAGQILKPALARGELHAIGATTLEEYRKFIEKDKALERRFQMVMVKEPDIPLALTILRGLKERYEGHHGVKIKDSALISAVKLSHRYITHRFLPDKAIDLVDEAASRLNMEINSVPAEVDEVHRHITHLKVEKTALEKEAEAGSKKRLKQIEKELKTLESRYTKLKSRWDEEKHKISALKKVQKELDKARMDLEKAQRSGLLDKAAQLKYGVLPDLNDKKEHLSKVYKENLLNTEVGPEEITAVVSRWTGIPVGKMLQPDRNKLLNMKEELCAKVIGQEPAITALSRCIRRSRAGLSHPDKPIGSFIFLGPTGVGKTETVRVLADFLFNSRKNVIRFDMGEYVEKHQISRLIGSPPGYIGHDEGGQLTEAVRRQPYSVVLFDEIEKAHPDIFPVLLPVLDEGHLTDSQGRTVNFKNTILVMTSNIGAELSERPPGIGREKDIQDALKKYFRPEFLNRIDEVVLFNKLKMEHIETIVNLEIKEAKSRLKEKNVCLEIDQKMLKRLARLGFSEEYGARPLKRLVQKELLNPLADFILSEKLKPGAKVQVSANDLKPEFKIN